ncbi:antibiotic biosynthesis monooxygenase family protein [Egicoccus halophilus]|uniref:ABM domain-containing protein n=1 Tax=Egicoccus halophilus TaxID=1670830 RepID=A0A8J3A6V8_9ACTN|nr:antibiotic biosynthesis monooxygenase family protein [Egicoccus halophilus]GGI05066.1 hypothetical protein GCM10011354_12240 [Egicoccus halophilus]
MTDPDTDGRAAQPGYVACSELRVAAEGRAALLAAFRDRLGAVDSWPGFRGVQVWQDDSDPLRFVMVTWWDDEAAFRDYLASDAFRRSAARIPAGEHGPRRVALDRFEVVAW